ncbi:MAG: Ig-like domain-containing protein [Anaerovoracaceae bacterium]
MRIYKKVLIVALTVILTVGMSSVSTFAAAQAKSIKMVTPNQKTYAMNVGQCKTFKAKTNPASFSKSVKWSSTQKSVATVNSKGKVTAKKAGKTTITAKTGKKSAKVTLTVKALVKSLKITGKSSIAVGEKVQFKTAISPSNASDKTVKWTSSDRTIASVSSKGMVMGVKTGSTVIKAISVNKKTAEYNVKVVAKKDLPMTADVKKIQGKADDKYAKQVTEKLAYEIRDDHTGFITSGSDAEKRAANYLTDEFNKIGLSNVEKVPVVVDKWQFKDASLSLKYKDSHGDKTLNLSNKNKEIVSYASTGTIQQPNKYDWGNMEIVNLKNGFEQDYDGLDVKGKIVLVEVNQYSDFWIDAPYMEAYEKGAAAIITYQSGGYGEYSPSGDQDRSKWDTINMQDICAEDLKIPCLSISPASADKILDALKANKESGSSAASANLMVDNQIKKNSVSYNVIGKIKGTGNTGQQILYAGHYDKYFEGYQDDAAAVGLTAGIAKAMIDSKYKPVNDIIFIAHCAEEWGQSGTSTDWAMGSWKMITDAKPEWRGKTLAIINFESPAIIPNSKFARMSATRELASQLKGFTDSELMNGTSNKVFSEPLQGVQDDGYSMTDGVSYQFNGVPVIADSTPRPQWYSTVKDGPTSHTKAKYHTQYDNVDTYSPEVMNYKIKGFASVGAYIDGMPAVELNMSNRCDVIEKAISNDFASTEQKAAYTAALSQLRAASETYYKKTQDLNARYLKAYQNGDEKKSLDLIRAEAIKLNTKSLDIFQKSQDEFVGLSDYGTAAIYHEGLQNNIEILDKVIAGLKSEDKDKISEVANDVIGGLWSDYEWYALSFSDGVCKRSQNLLSNTYLKERDLTNWGDKLTTSIPTYKTTKEMYSLYESGKTTAADYASVVASYQTTRDTLKTEYDQKIKQETKAMSDIAQVMK